MMNTTLFSVLLSAIQSFTTKSFSKPFQKYVLAAFLLVSSVGVFGQYTYKLITTTSDLVAGEKYLIGSAQTGTTLLLSGQTTNNRPAATGSATTITSNTITVTPATTPAETAKPYELTLGGTSGAWVLNDVVNGTILGPAEGSNSNNHLKANATATYTITFSIGAAVITAVTGTNTNGRNIIRYNYNTGSPIFSSYASGQADIYLYRKTYKVTYDDNSSTSGTVPTDATNYFSGATATTKTNSGTLAKAGFTFSGWNTQANGTGTDYAVSSSLTMPSDDVILYAKWITAGKISVSTGDWNTAATWSPSGVPAASDNITIAATHVVSTATALTRTGTTTVNGSFQLNNSGFVSGIDFTYGTAGTLIFNNSGSSFGVNSGHVYWPSTSGPVNVSVINTGGITMNTARMVTGTFQTSATVTLPSTLTLNGINQLNGGGYFNSAPTYGSASTLVYNATYGVSNEWTGNGAAGVGIPANVIVQAGTLSMPNVNRGIPGNITVNSGTTLNLNNASGDLYIGGNWSDAGTFNPNGRAVFFNGAIDQSITKTGGETFNYLINNKSAGKLILANNVVVNANSGGVLQLLNNGSLDLNGQTLSLNIDGGDISVNAAGRTITSGVTGAKLIINGNKWVTGAGTLIIDTNVTTELNKGFDFGFIKTTVKGTLQINPNGYANNNSPNYGNASTLVYNGVSAYGVGYEWTGNATSSGQGTPQNVTLTSSSVNMPNADRSLAGNLAIATGSILNLDGTSGDLYIGGNWNKAGTFNANNRAVFFRGGSAQTITGATTFDYLTINNTAGVTLVNSITNNYTLDFLNGKLTLGTNDLIIGSGGTITNATIAKYVVTNSTGQLKRTVGSSDVLFAVGNATYNPITFNNTGGTSDTYGVKVVDGALTTALDNSKTIKRKWMVTEGASGGSNLKVVGQYNTGEPDTNFNAGTTPKIGFYNGSNWTDVDATLAGSNPFTLTSTTNSSPATLTGTQYFALGKDNAFTTKATKYVITAITPTSPGAGYPFNVTVQAQDTYGFAANVSSNSAFSLITNGNAGAIGGTVSGTILSGTNSIVVTGVTLANAGTGVTVTATNSSGLSLTSGTSATFIVLAKASKLAFVGVPATGSVSANLSSFTVEARRPDNSVDTFYTGNITIAKASGSGTLSGTLMNAAVAGIASFSDAQFNAADTYTLTTTASGLTSDTSGNIVVTVSTFSTGDYRTNPSYGGSKLLFSSTTASGGVYPWQKWNGSNWIDVTGSSVTAAPENLVTKPDNIYLNFGNVDLAGGGLYNNIIVEGGYLFSGNTTVGLTLNANKTLDIKAGYFENTGKLSMSAGSTIYVRTDSEFELGSSSFNFIRNVTSNLIVEDDGYLYINNYLVNVWTGNENFAGESYVAVYGWDRTKQFFDAATDITNNSAGSKFGYLDIDLGTTGIIGNWTYVFPTDNFKLTNKDFYLTNSTSDNVTLNPGTMEIGGDFIIYGTGNVHGRGQTGSKIFNVKGNFEKNGTGEFRLNTGTDVANPVELNVVGNFKVNAGKFVIDNGATTNLTSKVNLKGNLYKSTSTYMTNSNTNSALVTFNFTGTTPQTVDLNVGATNDMLRYNFYIKNGAYVKPVTQDWKLATDSKITVEDGGTLDFGFNGTTPLHVITNGSQVNMTFNAQSGGILKITSPDGLTTAAAGSNSGNVQTPVSGRTFSPGAIYQYVGKSATPQVTGNAIANSGSPISGTGKIIVDMEDSSGKFNASSSRTIDGTGVLDIRTGVVTDDSTNGFIGSGNLTMKSANGKYITSRTGTQPELTGTSYDLKAGVIEFATTSSNAFIRSTPQYYNVDVSGSKIISGGTNLVINNLLKVTKSTAVLTIPDASDTETPYVVTAKKGVQVATDGQAIFKNNAQLMQDDAVSNSGFIKMERTAIVPSKQYSFWSSPVNGQSLYGLYQSGNSVEANRVFTYNTATDFYTIVYSGNFNKGTGYSIKGETGGNSSAKFVGGIHNSDLILPLSNLGNRYNLIGNPYPSNLDNDKFFQTNQDVIESTFWFWDFTGNEALTQMGAGYNSYSTNNFATWNASASVGTPGTSTLNNASMSPNGIISIAQGFIVQVKTGVSNPSVSYLNTQRNAIKGKFFGRESEGRDLFKIQMISPKNLVNTIAVIYTENASNQFDTFDSELGSLGSDAIYSFADSSTSKLGIQGKQYPLINTDVVPLGTKYFENGTYTIGLAQNEGVFANGQYIYLRDKLLNVITNLTEGAYEFTTTKGIEENRFEIVYKPGSTLVTTNPTKGQLQVYRSGEYFMVKSTDSKIDEVEVYDAAGRLYQKVKGGTTEVRINATALANGMYVLKIKRNTETSSKKIIK